MCKQNQVLNLAFQMYILQPTSFLSSFQFRAEKLVFEADDIAIGLLNLITLHGITTLVMGAAQNKYYTMYVQVQE
jgi:hypothetical protein